MAEVDLQHLSRVAIVDSHRELWSPEAELVDAEAVQRAVGGVRTGASLDQGPDLGNGEILVELALYELAVGAEQSQVRPWPKPTGLPGRTPCDRREWLIGELTLGPTRSRTVTRTIET